MPSCLTSPRTTALLCFSLALVTLMGVAGCGDDASELIISSGQEVELGEGVDQEIEAQYQIVHPDDPVAQWARDLVAPLQAASAEFRDPDRIGGYKVEVIADPALVNAFAAPGGFTYLSTGLILEAGSCAEIAGVMGHELAHVTERHSVEAIILQFGVATVADFFLGGGLTADIINTVTAFLQSTSFSRDDEAEADEVGLQIAYQAGYNPYGLVDFFETLLALSGGASGPEFLSSHPATEDRIRDISASIEARYGDAVVRGETQSYDCLNTQMSLEEVQARVRDGQLQIKVMTGTAPERKGWGRR